MQNCRIWQWGDCCIILQNQSILVLTDRRSYTPLPLDKELILMRDKQRTRMCKASQGRQCSFKGPQKKVIYFIWFPASALFSLYPVGLKNRAAIHTILKNEQHTSMKKWFPATSHTSARHHSISSPSKGWSKPILLEMSSSDNPPAFTGCHSSQLCSDKPCHCTRKMAAHFHQQSSGKDFSHILRQRRRPTVKWVPSTRHLDTAAPLRLPAGADQSAAVFKQRGKRHIPAVPRGRW